jgi:RNA-directed DNA polymerase
VQEINLFLRGWAGYFRYGNSAHAFDQIRRYALMRLALFLANATSGSRMGIRPDLSLGRDLGLISLNGTVVAPRPHRAWREKSNTAGEGRW